MTRRNPLVPVAIVVGLILIVVGVIYFIDSASALPSFFPGHAAGSSHHHIKHGIAALVVGVACLLFAWFQTGPAARRAV
jgi:uncharacterized membrane protein HdeD (DUF308 family)